MRSAVNLHEKYEFREIRMEEVEQAIQIEQICFPPHEACSPKSMEERIKNAPELFFVAIDRSTGKIAGFLNGIATNEEKFRDDFFTDITLHNPLGKNIMLLGLDVSPEHRNQGLAREIVSQYASREKKRGRQLLVLTCLEQKVNMYQKMEFEDLGMAASSWGGEEWHEMIRHLSPVWFQDDCEEPCESAMEKINGGCTTLCARCDGSGIYLGDVCFSCGGTGWRR